MTDSTIESPWLVPGYGDITAATKVGDDLKSFTIDHYAGESRPDMLSPDQDYVGYYRLVTPLRVLFVSAVHRAEKSDGQIKRLHVNVIVSEDRGESCQSTGGATSAVT